MSPNMQDVADAVDVRQADARDQLEALCRIPSIAFEGFDPEPVHASARATATLLESSGLAAVRILGDGDDWPAVFGEIHVSDDAPTVLLYAHHDVQPTGDVAAWSSPPFEPTERNGRLYGRGCADDKAGVVAHATAIAAWRDLNGKPPVNVKVIIEGEEEIGSPNLAPFLATHGDLLTADAVVVADLPNFAVGAPSLTTTLRGLVDLTVEITALTHSVHSGMYGGAVPDPITALTKLIAGLTDDDGRVTIPALRAGIDAGPAEEAASFASLPLDVAEFRSESGLVPGAPLAGDAVLSTWQRLWVEPNLTVIGMDVPAVRGGSNAIQPSARAKLSLRLAPGQDAAAILVAFADHLRAQTPLGLTVTVTPGAAGAPFRTDTSHPAAQAMLRALAGGYGVKPVLMGCGGSIPLLGPLQAAQPDAAMLMVGVEDPDSRAHGIDESLHLGDWNAACRSIALLFAEMAGASSR